MKKFPGSFLLYSMGFLVLLALSACGSGYSARNGAVSSSQADQGFGVKNGIAYVGASVCTKCHPVEVSNYLKGEHAFHSGHINTVANTTVTLPSGASGTCFTCHDPLGDGATIQSLVTMNSSTEPAEGSVALVTCEDCHGPGGQHYGLGPIPDPTPDWTACGDLSTGSCHAGPKDDHLNYHPENYMVASAGLSEPASWISSGWPAERVSILLAYENAENSHIHSIKSPNIVSGTTPTTAADGTVISATVKPLCSRCHTDQGAQLYKYANGDSAQLNADFPSTVANVADATPVQCRTCHDPHDNVGDTSGANGLTGNAGLLLNATTFGTVQVSGQFATCNNCHQIMNPQDGKWMVPQTYNASGVLTANNDKQGNPEVGHHDLLASSYGRIGFSNAENADDYFQTPAYTHFDDPNTPYNAGVSGRTTIVTGYIINATDVHDHSNGPNSNGGACLDCHNPHNPDLTINNEWAQSAHAGFILQNKLIAYNAAKAAGKTGAQISEAVHAAGVGSYVINAATQDNGMPLAWFSAAGQTQRNRTQTLNNGTVVYPCRRCHTSTGYRDMANAAINKTTWDQTKDNYTATGNQHELIYCWACHTTDVGDLRNPGGFSNATIVDNNGNTQYVLPTGADTAPGTGNAQVAWPANTATDSPSDSWVCINCHGGKQTGSYLNAAGATAIDDGHHDADAGFMYQTIGYDFPGALYNTPNFEHYEIGTAGATALSDYQHQNLAYTDNASKYGTNGQTTNPIGPCVACHMYQGTGTSPDHTFEVTTFDGIVTYNVLNKNISVGIVNGIPGWDYTCGKCHTNGQAGINFEQHREWNLNHEEAGQEAAEEALYNLLVSKGIPTDVGTAYAAIGTTTAQGHTITLGDVGAVYNLQTIAQAAWAYPHNNVYVKYLLFDSIDWVLNGKLTGTIDFSALPHATDAWPTPANSNVTGTFNEGQWAGDFFHNEDGDLTGSTPSPVTTATRMDIFNND